MFMKPKSPLLNKYYFALLAMKCKEMGEHPVNDNTINFARGRDSNTNTKKL